MFKPFIMSIAIIFSILSTAEAFDEITQSRLPQDMLVNTRYGNSNEIEIVISGFFPNTCFKKGDSKIIIADKKIFIDNLVTFLPSRLCNSVLIPYSKSIKISKLDQNKYELYARNKFGDYKKMNTFKLN